jgi:glucokinase
MFAGIDIGASTIKYGIVNNSGEVCFRNRKATPREANAEEIFEAVLSCGEALLYEASENDWDIPYIGVGSPGIVDVARGVISGNCPNLPQWIGFPLRDRLRDRLNLTILVDNDANCALVGEHRFGSARDAATCVMLTVGTGLGGAIMTEGKLFRGHGGAAGEFGQMRLLSLGEDVTTAPTIESIVSSRGMLSRYRELSGSENSANQANQITIRKLFGAARRGDPNATVVIRETGMALGAALANLVQMINPELIVLGGGVTEGGRVFVDEVCRTVRELTLPESFAGLAIRPAELGNRAGLAGAAVIHEYI